MKEELQKQKQISQGDFTFWNVGFGNLTLPSYRLHIRYAANVGKNNKRKTSNILLCELN